MARSPGALTKHALRDGRKAVRRLCRRAPRTGKSDRSGTYVVCAPRECAAVLRIAPRWCPGARRPRSNARLIGSATRKLIVGRTVRTHARAGGPPRRRERPAHVVARHSGFRRSARRRRVRLASPRQACGVSMPAVATHCAGICHLLMRGDTARAKRNNISDVGSGTANSTRYPEINLGRIPSSLRVPGTPKLGGLSAHIAR